MRARSLHECIKIGTALRFLQDLQPTFKVHGNATIIFNIELLLREMDNLDLHVSKRASIDLIAMHKILSKTSADSQIGAANATKLHNIISALRKTIKAEAEGIIALIITDKRYTVSKLTDKIYELFANNVFSNLPDIAKYDFSESGKCIAYERPTAAAFHILRGTEEVLKGYHKKFIKKVTGFKTWGNMTHDLSHKKTGKKPDLIVINHLDNIRQSFRNPTQHPEKTYDIDEAQDLLALCIDVTNRMIKELNKS